MGSIIITAITTFLVTILASYFGFKYFRKKIPTFRGRLDNNPKIVEFTDFLYKNEENIFLIDISLTEEDMEQFNKDFAFTLITSPDGDLYKGGLQIRFNRKDEENMFIDPRWTSCRIKGYFKVSHASGPQQGQFTIVLAHVLLESIYNNT